MKKVAIDDFARIRRLSDLTASPDGTRAAVTVNTANLDKNRYENSIWLYEDGRMRRLTGGTDGKKPLWLDDENILFPADRAGEVEKGEKRTVYNRISIHGGEAERAFSIPMQVNALALYKDGKYLALATCDNAPADREEDKGYSVFDELPFWFNGRGVINKLRSRLYIVDVEADAQEPLTEPLFDTHGFAWDKESDRLCWWGNAFENLNDHRDQIFLRQPDGAVVEVPLGGRYSVSACAFSLGRLIFLASTGEKMGTSENEKIYCADPETGAFAEWLAPDVSFGSSVSSDVHGGGASLVGRPEGVYHTETLGFRSHICLLDADGIRTLTPETSCVDALDERNGTIYYVAMARNGLQELYVQKPGEEAACVSSFNADYLSEHALSDMEYFTFVDHDGVEIDGWVLPPADLEAGRTYPAILDVHGGPRVVYGEVYFHEMQYWAAQGYYVFFCNPRGGAGKGDDFADILGDNYGVRDYDDLMEFTDEVLKRYPQIDSARLGMTGGSYGGFMANWIVGHTDRFAAVASQRSISNYISKCLTTDIGYYHNLSAIQADPWTSFDKMWAHSPLKYADKAVTPTLFIQSDEDYRCWMGDAVQMLQALLLHGVPAKMCLFHGENHELSRSGAPKNRVSRLREITEWMDKYCKKEAQEEDPA